MGSEMCIRDSFKPMCGRMGFIEEDDVLGAQVIYPKLSFTRLGLRDNGETFDALFNLYQKGSLDVDVILELLNVDPVSTRQKLERDLWSINDPMYNEMIRSVYSSAADKILENTEVMEIISEKLVLNYEPPAEGDDRY